MHIPDGYLSPQTYLPAYAVMVPIWVVASRRLEKSLRARQVPLLALSAAFTFLIMMFNVPIPGGTTGHAVGAVLVAILLGPWASVIAVSLALALQALLFGDGGITALGANCLNMAVIMPFTGWAVYRLIAGSSAVGSARQKIAGAIGGYVGLNMAALATALMFGIQPLIARDAAGRALYNPFGLKVAVPAMAIEHLLLFGIVEAVVTGLALAYLQRSETPAIATIPTSASLSRRLGIVLVALVLLSPLGLILPAKFGAGSAWGEWSANEVEKLTGYIPKGIQHADNGWRALLPDYGLPGQGDSLLITSLTYVLSAIVGVAFFMLVAYGYRKFVVRRESK